MRKKWRKFIWLFGCCFLLWKPETVAAEETLVDKIYDACHLYEGILQRSIEKREEELKTIIASHGYDYQLSMEYYNQQDNPFQNYDYLELMAVRLLGIYKDSSIYSHELTYTYLEYDIENGEDYLPKRMDRYVEVEKGKYQKNGSYYLIEPGVVNTYTREGDYYIKSGTEEVTLEREINTYIKAYLRPATEKELIEELGLNYDSVKKEYESIKETLLKIDHETDIQELNERLRESMWLERSFHFESLPEETIALLNSVLSGEENENRRTLIQKASELIGYVPYQWGGKPAMPGYDKSWWTFDETGEQKGLDCSGFVEWVYWTSGYPEEIYKSLASTASIRSCTEQISEEELLPGDLGILNNGESVNHVGLYVGDGYFIHCSSGKKTVTMEKFDFPYFYRVPQVETVSLQPFAVFQEEGRLSLSEEDIYLAAQTVSHEAAGEGMNGWIAVAEVLRNRLVSSKFPSTISEIIYAPKQFQACEDIVGETPTEQIVQVVEDVMAGKLSILNDSSVLYFRNPGADNNEDWGKLKFFRRIRNHVFYSDRVEQEMER